MDFNQVQMVKKDELLTAISPEELHDVVRPPSAVGGVSGTTSSGNNMGMSNSPGSLPGGSIDVQEAIPTVPIPAVTVFQNDKK